jgi:hypothetical protein
MCKIYLGMSFAVFYYPQSLLCL